MNRSKSPFSELASKNVPTVGHEIPPPAPRMNRDSSAKRFPIFGDNPVVAIDLDNTLCEYDGHYQPDVIGPPRLHAIWALEVFSHNRYEVVLHTNRATSPVLWRWIDQHAPGLVQHVNEHPRSAELGMNRGKPIADLFIDDRDSRFRGRPVDWIPLMLDLLEDGFLPQGIHWGPPSSEARLTSSDRNDIQHIDLGDSEDR